jgi:hypothetical protein
MGYFRRLLDFAEMTLPELEREWGEVQKRLESARDPRTVSACLIHQDVLQRWIDERKKHPNYVRKTYRNPTKEAEAKRRYREKLKAAGVTPYSRLSQETKARSVYRAKLKRLGMV